MMKNKKERLRKWEKLSDEERGILHIYIYKELWIDALKLKPRSRYMIYKTTAFQWYLFTKVFGRFWQEIVKALKPRSKKQLILYTIFIVIYIVLSSDSLYFLIF